MDRERMVQILKENLRFTTEGDYFRFSLYKSADRILAELFPPRQPQVGQEVEILGCVNNHSNHIGKKGIVKKIGVHSFDVNCPDGFCCATKVRPVEPEEKPFMGAHIIEHCESDKPKTLEDYLAEVFPLWQRGCPKFEEVKQAVKAFLDSLKRDEENRVIGLPGGQALISQAFDAVIDYIEEKV